MTKARKKTRPEAKDHKLCLESLERAEGRYVLAEAAVAKLEEDLEGQFDRARAAEAKLEAGEEAWRDERYTLKMRIQKLEEELKAEKRRASQAMDVASNASDAAGGIGRLLRSIVNHDVMETLRIQSTERRKQAPRGQPG